MIRVLIVDDEKIVRKGLISFMPWSEFGMEVVGEANNGENALQFLETNKVDLLLTDLSMPLMSGIELMREVRRKHPHIQIAVLTLHQDFEYVQEVLRLGALDYISKTQLEKERFEDVLARIASLMQRREGIANAPVLPTVNEYTEQAYVLYTMGAHHDEVNPELGMPDGAIEADAGAWFWPELPNHPIVSDPKYALVLFTQLLGLDRSTFMQLIRIYRKHDLFYEYDPFQTMIVVSADSLIKREKTETVYEVNEIKKTWLSSKWIYDDVLFEELIEQLRRIKMPPIRIARIFHSITDEWNRLYHQILTEPLDIEDTFNSWHHFKLWIRSAREIMRQANKKNYSEDIQNSIFRAMELAQHHLSDPPAAGEIAQMVSMSISYFSQCFKDIVGQTYLDYIRHLRVERAKEYLANTTKTILWIAEHIGYNDEKYFSRLFREQVGMLPSEYRNQAASKTNYKP